MIRNDLKIDKNYGYEKNHSTEHLFLKVVNDLYGYFDKNVPSVLVLFDLSAAFNTVDHGKLLDILKNEIGIDGTALSWFKSFLIGRIQKVRINDEWNCCMVLHRDHFSVRFYLKSTFNPSTSMLKPPSSMFKVLLMIIN